MTNDLSNVLALTFDVFGTVVDWRSSVSAEVAAFLSRHGVDADPGMFTDRWRREGYAGGMRLVRDGELPFQTADQLHLRMLKILLDELGVKADDAEVEELNRAWHRLHPWIDSPGWDSSACAPASSSPRSPTATSTFSSTWPNSAELPWDCVLSAQITGAFKPEPQCYQRAAELLGCRVQRGDDGRRPPGRPARRRPHRHAHRRFVPRPDEAGPNFPADLAPDPSFDIVATDFHNLAAQLDC